MTFINIQSLLKLLCFLLCYFLVASSLRSKVKANTVGVNKKECATWGFEMEVEAVYLRSRRLYDNIDLEDGEIILSKGGQQLLKVVWEQKGRIEFISEAQKIYHPSGISKMISMIHALKKLVNLKVNAFQQAFVGWNVEYVNIKKETVERLQRATFKIKDVQATFSVPEAVLQTNLLLSRGGELLGISKIPKVNFLFSALYSGRKANLPWFIQKNFVKYLPRVDTLMAMDDQKKIDDFIDGLPDEMITFKYEGRAKTEEVKEMMRRRWGLLYKEEHHRGVNKNGEPWVLACPNTILIETRWDNCVESQFLIDYLKTKLPSQKFIEELQVTLNRYYIDV